MNLLSTLNIFYALTYLSYYELSIGIKLHVRIVFLQLILYERSQAIDILSIIDEYSYLICNRIPPFLYF